MAFTIRPFTDHDAEKTATLIAESHLFYHEVVPTHDQLLTWLHNLPHGVEILLAEHDSTGHLAGLAGFSTLFPGPNTGPQLYLKELYVAKTYRRQNVGRLLFLAVLEVAQDRNYKRVDWVTGADNVSAQAFYNSINAQLQPKVYYRLADDNIARAAVQLASEIVPVQKS